MGSIDTSSWDTEQVVLFLDTWANTLNNYATHPVHGDLVKLVDNITNGIESGTIPVSVGRKFIESRMADVEALIAIGDPT